MHSPIVFVSYSHDTRAHKEWVLQFSTDLRINGVDAILDQWDLKPGQDITAFMHDGISRADRVLLICSKEYVKKANDGVGGVGYEKLIVSADIAAKTNTLKYIPIVRGNDATPKIPTFLGNRLYLDFDDLDLYEERLSRCLAELHGVPPNTKPQVGSVPSAVNNGIVFRSDQPPLRSSSGAGNELSPRELQVLSWARAGKTSWETSVLIGVSQATVTFHLKNAITKLDATNKTHAVVIAVQMGLID